MYLLPSIQSLLETLISRRRLPFPQKQDMKEKTNRRMSPGPSQVLGLPGLLTGPFFSLIMKILNPAHERRGIHVSHPLMKKISICLWGVSVVPRNERALRWNLILKGRMTQKIVRIRKIWRMMMMKGKTMKMIVGRGTSRRRTWRFGTLLYEETNETLCLAMHVLGETMYVTCRIRPKCEGRVMNAEEWRRNASFRWLFNYTIITSEYF